MAGRRLRPRGLRLSVRRLAARRFRVTGRLLLPKRMTRAQACGRDVVAVRLGALTRRSRLRRDCGFAVTIGLRKRPTRGRATLCAQWFGNRALLPGRSAARRLRAP